MNTFHVTVVSAEATIFSGEAMSVSVPGQMGDLQIFPNHAPLLTMVKPGTVELSIKDVEHITHIFIKGGVLEVQPGAVNILADTAVRAQDLDEVKAVQTKILAEEALRNKLSTFEAAKAEAELAMAIAMLKTIRKANSQHQH